MNSLLVLSSHYLADSFAISGRDTIKKLKKFSMVLTASPTDIRIKTERYYLHLKTDRKIVY